MHRLGRNPLPFACLSLLGALCCVSCAHTSPRNLKPRASTRGSRSDAPPSSKPTVTKPQIQAAGHAAPFRLEAPDTENPAYSTISGVCIWSEHPRRACEHVRLVLQAAQGAETHAFQTGSDGRFQVRVKQGQKYRITPAAGERYFFSGSLEDLQAGVGVLVSLRLNWPDPLAF